MSDIEIRLAGDGEEENAALAGLYADAYTVAQLDTRDKREQFAQQLRDTAHEPGTTRFTAHRDGRLVGAMRWHDYTMRLRDTDVFAGGLGAVAVSFEARRQGVGAALVRAFVEGYVARGAVMALLHPFRHDFYRRNGFGYGTKMSRYRFAPATLPRVGDVARVAQVDASATEALAACYERVRQRTNGLIVTPPKHIRERLENCAFRTFAYRDGEGAVRGFAFTQPYLGTETNVPELKVFEPMAEHPEALVALMSFFGDLRDQFRVIVVETQDETFEFMSTDPRSGDAPVVQAPAYLRTNIQGSGVMYRVLEIPKALAAVGATPYAGSGPRLAVTVADSILPHGGVPVEFAFVGAPLERDVALAMDVADFSSLIAGSVRLRALHQYGLVSVSDAFALPVLDARFAPGRAPLCTTRF